MSLTSQIRYARALDTTATDGSGKTGLAFSDVTAKYLVEGGTLTALTTETITTLGTYQAPSDAAHIRIKELSNADPTKGVYEIHFHNTQVASTGVKLWLFLSASGAAFQPLEVSLQDVVSANIVQSLGVAITNSDFTVASATSTTVTLPTTYTDSTTLPDDSRYVGAVLRVVSGTGQGQLVILTTATGTARQYNVFAGSMPVQLDNTSQCVLDPTSRARADLSTPAVNVTQFGGSNGTFSGGKPAVKVDAADVSGRPQVDAASVGGTDVSDGIAGPNFLALFHNGGTSANLQLDDVAIAVGNMDVPVSGVPAATASSVWSNGTRTLTSFSFSVSLAASGLDAIAVTDPGAVANMTTLPKMIVGLWRWMYKKRTLTASQFKLYADNGSTVNATSTVTDDGTTQTEGPFA